MATTFSLVIQEGPTPGLSAPLIQETFLIGRDPSSDLHIQDIEVSRRHARLISQSGGHALEDLGSTNGTFVNGERIRTITVLHPGDSIRLGETITLRYQMEPAGLETTPPSTQQFRSTPPRPTPRPTASLHPLEESAAIDPLAARVPPASPPSGPPAGSVPVPAAPARRPAPLVPPLEPEAQPASPAPRRHPRRKGPVISRNWMIGCAVLGLLAVCIGSAFLWYVDANLLWCDVFGGMIAACR